MTNRQLRFIPVENSAVQNRIAGNRARHCRRGLEKRDLRVFERCTVGGHRSRVAPRPETSRTKCPMKGSGTSPFEPVSRTPRTGLSKTLSIASGKRIFCAGDARAKTPTGRRVET